DSLSSRTPDSLHFTGTSSTQFRTLSLHDALPIYRDRFIIFRGAPNQRWAADVDLFDRFRERHVRFRDRRFERIKVHYDQVDRLEPTLACFSFVFGIAAFVKQAAVHAWVQSFHAPFEHFGKGGETGTLGHRHIVF